MNKIAVIILVGIFLGIGAYFFLKPNGQITPVALPQGRVCDPNSLAC